jgi:hypothetical protein
MEKYIESCKCGSTTFVTALNSYDIYELENGKLKFQQSELIDDEIKFYCRECGEEFIENE